MIKNIIDILKAEVPILGGNVFGTLQYARDLAGQGAKAYGAVSCYVVDGGDDTSEVMSLAGSMPYTQEVFKTVSIYLMFNANARGNIENEAGMEAVKQDVFKAVLGRNLAGDNKSVRYSTLLRTDYQIEGGLIILGIYVQFAYMLKIDMCTDDMTRLNSLILQEMPRSPEHERGGTQHPLLLGQYQTQHHGRYI